MPPNAPPLQTFYLNRSRTFFHLSNLPRYFRFRFFFPVFGSGTQ